MSDGMLGDVLSAALTLPILLDVLAIAIIAVVARLVHGWRRKRCQGQAYNSVRVPAVREVGTRWRLMPWGWFFLPYRVEVAEPVGSRLVPRD